MIKLYLHKITSSITDFEILLQQIPMFLQQRILKRKQIKKRESSLRGYLLLQQGLQNDFGTDLEQMSFLPSGKPVFEGKALYFNISHAADRVGVAISNKGILGLDIEAFRKFETVESAFLFFSPIEQQAILKDPTPDRKLIEFWSKKEALVKAVGGQMFDMASKTDVRFSTTMWEGEAFYFYSIDQKFDGFTWLATSFSTNKVITTQVESLNPKIDFF